MSWAGIASNQCVSCENLQDAVTNSVFVLKNTIPSSVPAKYKQITKTEADFYVYIDTAYAPYASKASNQLVVKSNLVVPPTTTTTTTVPPTTTTTTTSGSLSVRVYANKSTGSLGNQFLYEIDSSPSDPPSYSNSLTVTSTSCGLLTTLSVPSGYYVHIACDDGAGTFYAFTTTTVITAGTPSCPSDLGNACAANIPVTLANTCITFVTNASNSVC